MRSPFGSDVCQVCNPDPCRLTVRQCLGLGSRKREMIQDVVRPHVGGKYYDEFRDLIIQVLERVGRHWGNVDDVGPLHDKHLVAECVENLLLPQQHVRFLAHVRVHGWGATRCRIGDADGQVAIAMPLSFHYMDELPRSRVDYVQITLGKCEVPDVGHRGRLERPGNLSRLQDAVRVVLRVQLPARFIDVKDQFAVLDPLPRLCIGWRMGHNGLWR
jgi:hypothetical protein